MSDEKTTSLDITNTSAHLLQRECGLLSEFKFSVASPNIVGGISQPLTITATIADGAALPFTLSQLTMHADDVSDRVWLSGNVAFLAQSIEETPVIVEFRIYRNFPVTGQLIFSCIETSTSISELITSTFYHVDFPVIPIPGQTEVPYFLVVVVILGRASFLGPITFTGAEIERNRICNP